MRCPSCSKFVSFEEEDPEVEALELDEGTITATVRIVNSCAECGDELTEATLEMEVDASEDLNDHLEGEDHTLVIEEHLCERTSRVQGTGRGTKTFYGAEVSYRITCACDPEWSYEGSLQDDIQASQMDALG